MSFERTPGGLALPSIVRDLKLKPMAINIAEIEAKTRFISEASGNITVLIGHFKEIPNFLRYHLPAIFSNERIHSINHIEARQFKLVLAGEEPYLEKTQDQVLTILSGQEGVARLFGKDAKAKALSDDLSLETAIDKVGGRYLNEATDNMAVSRLKYYRALEKMVEHEASKRTLGWRSKLLPVALRQVFEKEGIRSELAAAEKGYRKADKEISRVKTWLTSEEIVKSIRHEALKLAGPRSIIPDASNKGFAKAVELQLDKKIRAGTPQVPQALERAVLALNPKKGRGM